ncbi:nectin-3-like [Mixophyes fleayi]|uniref:nectin-3-like n=1 Tax=Mixophyes fleayi TaxID=3061075 RepID=UPI003F4DEC6E
MRHLSVFLCFCGLVHGSIVETVEKQEATVGGNVTLQCQLITTTSRVLQVTWQKESGNFTGPVATYIQRFGKELFGNYSNRIVQFTVDALNVSAITISPVTLEDQGCFSCIFNIFPFGANSGRTCLDVYEIIISDPILEIHQNESPDTSEKLRIVTCSATGQPAPSITWELPDNLEITPETYTIVNLNRTVTVISNFTQTIPWTLEVAKVTCVVRHPALYSEKRLSALIDYTILKTDITSELRASIKEIKEIKADVTHFGTRIDHLENKMEDLVSSYNDLISAHDLLQEVVVWIKDKLVDIEARSRGKNIKIRGMTDSIANSDLYEYAIDLFHKLLSSVSAILINRIHHLAKSQTALDSAPKYTLLWVYFYRIKEQILQASLPSSST